MPLYEYECLECGARFELIQRLKDRPLKKFECDQCGEVRPVKKLLSAPAFQFKGEGWYVTDYGQKKGKEEKSAGPDQSKAKETKGSSEGKGSANSKDSSKETGAKESSKRAKGGSSAKADKS